MHFLKLALSIYSMSIIFISTSNSGHYDSIGVRGGNAIIKIVPVSNSFGYLIMDSVVAPHGKTDGGRQLLKTIQLTLKNVRLIYMEQPWIKSWL